MELVRLVHLLEEDEGEDGVRAQAEVVRGEALPQREETLVLDNLPQNISGSPVLRFTYGHKILGFYANVSRFKFLTVDNLLIL